MKVANAFAGINLEGLFPDSSVLAKNIGIQIAAFHAQRDDERAARRRAAPDDSHYAKLLEKFDAILIELNALRADGASDPLSMQVKKAKKMTNRLHKCINELDRIEREVPFGDKCHSLIFAITHIVMRNLGELGRMNPQLCYRYLTGVDRHYWLTTTTQSLCTGLNRNTLTFEELQGTSQEKRDSKRFQAKSASFRGKDGFYASLEKSGFILEKQVDGNVVRLKINLDWVFGWSLDVFQDKKIEAEMAVSDLENSSNASIFPLFGDNRRGNSSRFSQNNEFKETEDNSNGEAALRVINATEVAKEGEESEEKKQRPALNTKLLDGKIEEKNCAAPKIEESEIALDVATDSANRLMKAIFTRKNVENGKIRYNSTCIVTEITRQDAQDMRYWMLDTMRAIKLEDDTWSDVGTLVNEAIHNTAKYIQEHPTRWIYHPKFYLNPDFFAGSLKYYINTFLRDRPISDDAQASIPQNPFTPQIQWLIEHGGDRRKVLHYVRKFGEQPVTDAIAFAGARKAGGFEPMRGDVNYIFGILKNMDPRLIGKQAALEKEKTLAKQVALQMENSDAWTTKKVETLVRHIVRKSDELQRCNREACQKIAERANQKKAVKSQVEIWIEGHAKGSSTLFL